MTQIKRHRLSKISKEKGAKTNGNKCDLRRQEEKWMQKFQLLIYIYEYVIRPFEKKRDSKQFCNPEFLFSCTKLFVKEMCGGVIRSNILQFVEKQGMEKCTESKGEVYSKLLRNIWNFFKNNKINGEWKLKSLTDLESEKPFSDITNCAKSAISGSQELVQTDETKLLTNSKEVKDENEAARTHRDNKDSLEKEENKDASRTLMRCKKVKKHLNFGLLQRLKEKHHAVIIKYSKKRKFLNCFQLFEPIVFNSKKRIETCNSKFRSEINELLSNYENPSKPEHNVLLLHSEEKCHYAKELSSKLRHSFNTFADCELETIYSSDPVENRMQAIIWADCVIIVDPPRWLVDANNLCSSPERSNRSLYSRYQFSVLESIYVFNSSINLKVLHMIEESGCNYNRREIGAPISIHNGYERFANSIQEFVVHSKNVSKLISKISKT